MQLSKQDLAVIANHLPAHRSEKSLMRAAIAIILRDGAQGTEVLLMQRAKHEDDPWSGQMSFPGGKIDAGDSSAKAAAIREATEEVAIVLTEQDYIGQLDDLYGIKVDNHYSVHVACFVFKPKDPVVPVGNYEVEDLVWLPLSYLDDPVNAHPFYHPSDERNKMPAVLINLHKDQILWGLSLRMLTSLFELLDKPMRVIDNAEHQVMREIETRNVSRNKLDMLTQKILNINENK